MEGCSVEFRQDFVYFRRFVATCLSRLSSAETACLTFFIQVRILTCTRTLEFTVLDQKQSNGHENEEYRDKTDSQ